MRDLAESPNGTLWAGTDYEGLLRIRGTRDVERWTGRSGLPTGWVKPFVAGAGVRFGTAKGIYVYNETQNAFAADPALDVSLPADSKGAYRFRQDNRGNLWIASNGENGVLRMSKSGRYQWDPVLLRRAGKMVVHDIYDDADGSIWLATEEGIIQCDAGMEKIARRAYPVVIRQVQSLGDGSILHYGSNPVARSVVLPFQRNSIAFSFVAPGNDDNTQTEYQAYLEGYERPSGSWAPGTERAYNNLSEGRYVFRVRAHNLYGAIADEARFPFEILAPWYRAKWAYLLYGLAFIGSAFGAGKIRSRALEAKNRRLQAIIDERTAEVQAQAAALQKQNRELERLDQEKNEFLSIAAHDLKSPLFEISMGAKLLRDDSGRVPPERIEEYAREMESSASLMHRIVSNLLDIQRIEEGAIAVAAEECEMNQIAEGVIKSFRHSAQAKRVGISFERSSSAARVIGDTGILAQIVDNLLSNAIKYSYPDSGVIVRVRATAATVRLEVEDRGPGISVQEQARLFTKFGRLSTQPTGGESSTGLGLAIVKRLINAMGGEAGCSSIVGQGSTFYIQMPAKSDGNVDSPTAQN